MASPDNLHDSTTGGVNEYYRTALGSEALRDFKDLDNPTHIGELQDALQSYDIQRFVLDFSDAAAFATLNTTASTLAALLDTERPQMLHTRWINIFFPSKHTSILELLAKHYDFSPRLLALMCSDPKASRLSRSSTRQEEKKQRKLWRRLSVADSVLEDGPDELSEDSSIASYDSVTRGNLYKIINDLWHYASIDFGRNYVCIGYNSLYGNKPLCESDSHGPLPHCTRVWTWLVLCSDNTVISINEDPFPFVQGPLSTCQQLILNETRRNLVSIFRSLSTVDEASLMTCAPMTVLAIRARLGDTPEETLHHAKDMPGLLFYYLFENWHNSYTLITRKESRYGLELDALRKAMFKSPTLAHIDRLDGIGNELGVLKRHYEAYNRIIDRLLEPQTASTASIRNMQLEEEEAENRSQTSLSTIRPTHSQSEVPTTLGVSLPSPARVRFKRLHDLIDLYALSEVNTYLAQKDSLITMNFQLIAIKESLDVERLTRITLLLTKFTILFLPISFVTSYFSVPLEGWVYGVREYWVTCAVTLVVSFGALTGFGVVSGSVQTVDFVRAVGRAVKRCGRWVRERL